MKKKDQGSSDLKHPTEFPSLSLSLLLFCILRIDWKKEEISPLPFSTCHRGRHELRKTLYKVEKRCGRGGKGIKHLTKMSRVFGGWFLDGDWWGWGGNRCNWARVTDCDRIRNILWRGGWRCSLKHGRKRIFYLIGRYFSPWDGEIRGTCIIVKYIEYISMQELLL